MVAGGQGAERWGAEVITLRQVIRLRVREEVARNNGAWSTELLRRLEPLPGRRERWERHQRHEDWERQAEVALAAHVRGEFMVMVAGRVVLDLDEELDPAAAAAAVFVPLVPLAGA